MMIQGWSMRRFQASQQCRSLEALRAYFHIGSTRVLADREQMRQALTEHTEIVAAVSAGDPERAECLMRVHTMRSLDFAFPTRHSGPAAAERAREPS